MKPDKRSLAQNLYLNTDKTQQEIADILDVNRRTVYLWIKNGRWEEMKIAARQAPGMVLQDIYNHITAVNDKIRLRDECERDPTMQEVEKLRKLVGITATIQKRSMGAYVEAFQELLMFIATRDHELAMKLVPHADTYVMASFGDKEFHMSKERDENILNVNAYLKKQEETGSLDEAPAEATPIDVTPPAPSERSHDTPDNIIPPAPSEKARERSHDTSENVTPPAPSERVGERSLCAPCDINGIFCDKISDAKDSDASGEEPTEPAPNAQDDELGNITKEPEYPTEKNFPSSAGALAKEDGNGIFSKLGSELAKSNYDKIMELPPLERPSPWRNDNIVWVTHIDHLDYPVDNFGNHWGELKMSDSIRYYPDVDPGIIQNQAIVQIIKDKQKEQEETRNRPAA